MSFAAGTKLGPYEILALIGAGGMGEVFRARDTRLGRDVAIKVAAEQFSERFEREARAIAALNHVNICHLYDVGPNYLVMEYIEGETLKGPLIVSEAMPIIQQLIDGIEAAHEKNIIHRDLKPANIKITPDGVVKILDFGLARAADPAPESSSENSPTMTMGATQAGTILGTAAYMAPEQAKGKTADRRSDIWSFGVVTYELLTGKRPFESETVVETLGALLNKEPDWTPVPERMRKVLGWCLEKDRKKRLQAIGDARRMLEETAEQSMRATSARAKWRLGQKLTGIAAGILAVALVIALWVAWRAARPVEKPLMRLSVDLGPDAVAGPRTTVSISPDGRRIVFPVKSGLAMRLLDQPQATSLSGTETAADPFFSPDGEWIGFFADGKMKKVSVQGGAVVTLCDAPFGRGGTWGEDGSIIATLRATLGFGLYRIPAAGGAPQVLSKLGKGEATHRWPQILPGGQAVLFTSNNAIANFNDATIEALSLKTGETKIVQRGGYFGRYLPGGYLVYIHQGTLFGVAFDLKRLEARGTPTPLLEDVAGSVTSGGGQLDFSANGTLVYLNSKPGRVNQTIVWLDGAGKTQPLTSGEAYYRDLRFSPDGTRLAYSDGYDIKVYDWGRDTTTRLSFTAKGSRSPVWTPDGKHIIFLSQGVGTFLLEWKRADGAGEAQQLWESKSELRPSFLSPDGKRLAFSEQSQETGFDSWTLPLDTSDPEHPKPGKVELFLRTPFNEYPSAFSPDGRWMAYVSDESGRNEVYVRPFPAGGPSGSGKWQISTGGGGRPIWSRNGQELFYESLGNRIMVVAYTARSDSFAAEKSRLWSNLQLAEIAPGWNMDLAPDGKRFAVLPKADLPGDQKGSVHVTFLLNFFDEVRRKVPMAK